MWWWSICRLCRSMSWMENRKKNDTRTSIPTSLDKSRNNRIKIENRLVAAITVIWKSTKINRSIKSAK